MEDIGIRAIFIGVSVFVIIMTLTAIILYYNTARSIADTVSDRTDIASSFDNIVNSDNLEDVLTGVEIRSLINKYVANSNVQINIISDDENLLEENTNVNNNEKWLIKINNNMSIISEAKLDLINPVKRYTVEKVENQSKITLQISKVVEE